MSKLDPAKIKTEWDLSPLLTGDDDPKAKQYRAEMMKAADEFAAKWRDRTDYMTDPAVLQEAMDESEARIRRPGWDNEGFYLHLRTSLDSEDTKLKAQEQLLVDFNNELASKLQFFELNICKIDPKYQPAILAYPGLQRYKHYLERCFLAAKYQLSEPEERILRYKEMSSHYSWTQMVSDFLASEVREVETAEGRKKLTEEEIGNLMRNPNKKIRDSAAKAHHDIQASNVKVAERELNAILNDKKVNDQLRGYERPDTARHIGDDIDTAVVDVLVTTVAEHYKTAHRFYKLRAALLKQPKLDYHERSVEIGQVDQPFGYQQSSQLVHEVFSELDPAFADIYERMLSRGQLDAFPRRGKRGGAFCSSYRLHQPTYVMLNHTDSIRDVSTIAHEMGHAINAELMRERLNGYTFATPMSTAEVASTFMEDFVLDRLLMEADEDTELSLRISQLDDIIATVYRQVALYRFEQELHASFREKGYLSAQEIGKLFTKHMAAYMGPSVEQSPGSENWWVGWPHIRYFFYVYSYAGGLLISKAMQAKVRADTSFISQVKTFLGAGIEKSPKELFADMGIDITDKAFWEKGLQEIDQLLTDTETLAKKLSRI